MKKSLMLELVLVLIVISGIVISGFWYTNYLEQKKIVEFNKLSTSNLITNVNTIIQLKSNTLQKYVEDYSHWTDMYRFTLHKSTKWAKINLDVSLNTFDIDYLWVFDKEGKKVYGINSEGSSLVNFPLPEPTQPIAQAFNKHWLTTYFLKLPTGELIEVIGSWIHLEDDINRSAKSSLGYFFSAKIWNQEYIASLEKLIGGKIELSYNQNSCNTNHHLNDISFKKELFDYQGVSVALLCVSVKNQLKAISDQHASDAIIFFIIFSLSLIVILLLFLFSRVVAPISAITSSIRTENLNILEPYQHSHNEFGSLARLIKSYQETKIQKEKLRDQLFHAGKMASLGILGAGIAHEFNNPLTVVLANAQILTTLSEQNKLTPELLNKQLTAITHQAERMRLLVDRMREFSRAETKGIHEIESNIATIIDKSLILLRMQLEKYSINMNINISPNLPTILCDPVRVETIIQNLISNACDALAEMENKTDRQISVEASHDEKSNTIIIKITDNAGGIPESIQQHIFDPFFTTKPVGKGTGLGLSLAYGAVKDHGGDITFKTDTGKGTIFEITLPCKT